MDLDQRLNHESRFRYPPIDPKTQIRLLRPLRITNSTNHCRYQYVFQIAKVKDLFQISYSALSYTWGSASSREHLDEINVDGQPFWIRRNLHDFLVSWHGIVGDPKNGVQHFAKRGASDFSTGEEGLIFIDAICIDQLGGENNTERHEQVHLMREIYHRANGVISWLGMPPENKTRNGVQALAAAVRTGLDIGSQAARWTAAQRAGYRYLSHNRYWSRVWVLQEILLARDLIVCCGESVFPLRLFASRNPNLVTQIGTGKTPAERVITYRLRTVLVSRPESASMRNARDIAQGQGANVLPLEKMLWDLQQKGSGAVWETQYYQTQLPDSLHDLMARYGHLECSDPRDKLYGLLGLLKDKSRKTICVDYDKGADFAFYQGLKAGVTELVNEIEAEAHADMHVSRPGSMVKAAQSLKRISRFHEDIRQAFGEAIGAEEAGRILQKVLDEMQVEEWLAEVDSALLLRDYGYSSEVVSWGDFRKLSSGGRNTARKKVEHGWLHRWHARQYKALSRAKKRIFSKTRSCGEESTEKEKLVGISR